MLTWLMPHLHLHDYPPTRSLSGAINSSNDMSIQEEIDLLNRTAETASAQKERLAQAFAIILEHVASDISDRPRAVVEILRPPQGQLRV